MMSKDPDDSLEWILSLIRLKYNQKVMRLMDTNNISRRKLFPGYEVIVASVGLIVVNTVV